MSEANFWIEIKKNVGHKGHWSRIESHATADGFPDTVFTIKMVDGFIELKQEDDYGKTPKIRPSQVRWFRRAARQGCNCWLFSKIDDFYLLHEGKEVPALIDLPFHEWVTSAKVVWKKHIDWNEFLALITKRIYQ